MNRREFAAAAGIGVGGLLFPSGEVSGGVPGEVLEGMSDSKMAQLIAEFPQGPGSSWYVWYRFGEGSGELSRPKAGIWKLRLSQVSHTASAKWWIEGETAIRARRTDGSLYSAEPDTRFLGVVEFYYATDSQREEDLYTPDLIFRRRNGLWFGIDLR